MVKSVPKAGFVRAALQVDGVGADGVGVNFLMCSANGSNSPPVQRKWEDDEETR